MKKRRPVILIVEDELLIRLLFIEYLQDEGYEVIEAGNGAETLAVLSTRADIRAVVTDVCMPGTLDGFSVASFAREHYPDMAIVVVSARPKPLDVRLAPDIPFVLKPEMVREAARLMERHTDMDNLPIFSSFPGKPR